MFITLEGGEGVGKTTNLKFIEEWLQAHNIPFVRTREPGGTPYAERIRELLITPSEEAVADMAELLLIFAARAQHVNACIRPALNEGQWVLCDRFTDATFAYQGAGRGMDSAIIEQLESLVQGALRPDATLLLDMSVADGMRRASRRGDLDRFEQEKLEFFEAVRQCYRRRAEAEPSRFHMIDAAQPLEHVQSQIADVLQGLMNRESYGRG